VQSLRNFPDPFLGEIARQPEAIRRTARGLADQREGLERLQGAAHGARVLLFTGMGASYHACYPAIAELAAGGVAALLVDSAELVHFRRPLLQPGTIVVAVSQSGHSAEVVRLAEEIGATGMGPRPFLVAVTNGTANRLADRADVALDTRAGEEGGPSTVTFAGALVTLACLARVLAGGDPGESAERTEADADQAAGAAGRLVARPEALGDQLLRWHAGRAATVLLGRGPARASAEMGALLLKETAGLPAEALEAAQFRHGPLELAGPDLAAVVVATEPETTALDVQLATELGGAGSAVLLVTSDPGGHGEAPSERTGTVHLGIGPLDRTLAPAVSIVPVQLLSWRLAVERGRSPGELTRASKVTTSE
jgi:glucosamine--fructose-6-phosphate aminotransferase (isomerizing)